MQGNELAGQPRHGLMLDQIVAHLGRLHGGRGGEHRFEIAIFEDQLARRLGADARYARHIVDAVAHQRKHVAQLLRRHPELAYHIVRAAPLVLHRVEHVDTGLDELHQILVGADDGDMPARLDRAAGIGCDDVVRLEPALLDAGQRECAGGDADQRELRDEILGRGRPLRLVFVIEVVAEGVRALVQHHRQMGRPLRLVERIGKLPQHRRIAIDGADIEALAVGERRQLVIGAEDVSAAIDQIEMILFIGHGWGIAQAALSSNSSQTYPFALSEVEGPG
jgi:hypothetical protein